MITSYMGSHILLAAIGSIVLPFANCYWCYECFSVKQKQCGYEFNRSDIKLVDCERPHTCKKVLLPTVGGGYEPIKRGCFDDELCTPLSVCLSCESDLCNSSNSVRFELIIIVIISIVNLLLYY